MKTCGIHGTDECHRIPGDSAEAEVIGVLSPKVIQATLLSAYNMVDDLHVQEMLHVCIDSIAHHELRQLEDLRALANVIRLQAEECIKLENKPIKIGSYELTDPGTEGAELFLRAHDGEGMGLDAADLEPLLAKFFAENF